MSNQAGFVTLTAMKMRPTRLATRAIIVHEGALLLVNAYPDHMSDLWCAPGGGVEPGQSLPDNLRREVQEETGLSVSVGPLALVNEFHDPATGFHQVDLFFRCVITGGEINADWQDAGRVVTLRRFFRPEEMASIRLKPDSLPKVAFSPGAPVYYDPLEVLVL